MQCSKVCLLTWSVKVTPQKRTATKNRQRRGRQQISFSKFFLRLLKTKHDKTNLCHTEKWFPLRGMLKYLDVAQPTGSKSLHYRSGIVN